MKLRILDSQYKKIFLNEQFWEHPEEMTSPNTSLSNAPDWFDVPSAQWVSAPTGGGVYMDKYGSMYGKNTAIRKKPLTDKELKAKEKAEADKKASLQNTIDNISTDDIYDFRNIPNLPVGSDRMATLRDNQNQQSELFRQKLNYKAPLYTQNSCNSTHVKKCNSMNKPFQGNFVWIAVDTTKKGRDIDIETGNYSRGDNGEYYTLGRGKWDNEDYTVCECRKFNVSELGELEYIPDFAQAEFKAAKPNYGPKLTKQQALNQYHHSRRVWYNSKVPLTQEEKVHRLLDVLAIGALLLPGGVAIAAAIETVNAGIYFSEGDVTTGVITLVGTFALPGFIGAAKTVGRSSAKQIGKAWVGYSDDLAKGINSNKAYYNNVGKITDDEAKLVFQEMATNPNYIKNQLGVKNVNRFNSAIKNNPQLAYKKIKTMPDVKKISGIRKNIKHAYTDEFITPLPVWLRGVLTGGIGTLYHFMTDYGDKKKDRELVKALMSRYKVPAKTKDGKSVEDIIVESPAVKELEKQFAWMAKLYGDEPVFGSEYHKDKMGDPEVITVQLLEKIQRLVKYVAKLPIEDLTERQLTTILQKHKSDFNNNIEYIISKVKKIIPKLKNMEIIDLIDSEGLGYEKNNQSDIGKQKIINLKGDNTYEYAKWGEYWFFRKKGETPWKFMKTEIDKSNLEKSYKDEQNKYDKASEGEIDALLDSLGF